MTTVPHPAHHQSLVYLAAAVAVLAACGDAGSTQARGAAAGSPACLPASEISEAVGFDVVQLEHASRVIGSRTICAYQSARRPDQTFVSVTVLPASDRAEVIDDVRSAAKTMTGTDAEVVEIGDEGFAYGSSGKSEAVAVRGDRIYRVDLTTTGLASQNDKGAAIALVRKLMR